MDRIKETGEIFYAQADRPWILEGAAVRVSMIGFDDGSETVRLLNISKDTSPEDALRNARAVSRIHSNLTAEADFTKAVRLSENRGICYQGPVKIGPFEIDHAIAQKMLKAVNINGKNNSDVVRPWLNASEITHRPNGMFIIDFSNMSLEQASLYEEPFEFIKTHVKPLRDTNRRDRRRDYWWQHGETVPGMGCVKLGV